MSVLLRLSAGLIGWAVAFCLIYAVHGIGCTRGWAAVEVANTDLQRIVLAAAWLASLAATLALALRLSRQRTTWLDRAAMATGWSGFAATAVSFLPVLWVPSCL